MPSEHAVVHAASGVDTGLAAWLEHLRVLSAPSGVVHVGAGSGFELSTYRRWDVPRVVLVEADADSVKRLRQASKDQAGWQVHQALVNRVEGEARFNVVTNPRESGLLPVEALRGLWRNLHPVAERVIQATTLDALLEPEVGANWLVVDCLPAAAVLEGATRTLEGCVVVIVRAELGSGPGAGRGTTLHEVEALLSPLGFRRLASEEERMPLIGRCLFFRGHDPARAAQLSDLSAQLAAQTERIATLEGLEHDQRQQLVTAAQEMSALQASLDAATQAEAAATERAAVSEAQQRVQQAEIAALQASGTASAAAVDASKAELRGVALICDELRLTHANQLAELETLRSALRDQAELQRQGERQLTSALAQEAVQKSQAETYGSKLTLVRAECDALQQSNRDLAAQQADMSARLEESALHLSLRDQRIVECESALVERDARVGSLEAAGVALQSSVDGLNAQLRGLEAQVAERASLAEARDAQLGQTAEQLRQAQSAAEASERLAVEQLERSRGLLAEREQAVERTTAEVSRLTALLEDCQQRLAAADDKRRHFDLEMARAEAQIGLIRDLLLRPA